MVSRRLEKPGMLRYNAWPMAIPAKDFVSLLQDAGFDFFTGVPDSTLGGIIATLIERRGYIPAGRADDAGGLGGGAHLGGRIPAGGAAEFLRGECFYRVVSPKPTLPPTLAAACV